MDWNNGTAHNSKRKEHFCGSSPRIFWLHLMNYLLQMDVLIDDRLVPLRVETLSRVFGFPLVLGAAGDTAQHTWSRSHCITEGFWTTALWWAQGLELGTSDTREKKGEAHCSDGDDAWGLRAWRVWCHSVLQKSPFWEQTAYKMYTRKKKKCLSITFTSFEQRHWWNCS